jgi:hypothetical protein
MVRHRFYSQKDKAHLALKKQEGSGFAQHGLSDPVLQIKLKQIRNNNRNMPSTLRRK